MEAKFASQTSTADTTLHGCNGGKTKASEVSEALDSSTECSEIISEDATSTNMANLAFPETAEMENITRERECGTNLVEKSEKRFIDS